MMIKASLELYLRHDVSAYKKIQLLEVIQFSFNLQKNESIDRSPFEIVPKYKEYLVRWKGEEENETSWEREDALWQFIDTI